MLQANRLFNPLVMSSLARRLSVQYIRTFVAFDATSLVEHRKPESCQGPPADGAHRENRITRKELNKIPCSATARDFEQIDGRIDSTPAVLPLPLSTIGPLYVNGVAYMVPLATADHALLSKLQIGLRAIEAAGGAFSKLSSDCMVMSPLVIFESAEGAAKFAKYLEEPERLIDMRRWFEEVSTTAELESVECRLMGSKIFVRFTTSAADASFAKALTNCVERIFAHLHDEWKEAQFQVLPDILESSERSGKTVRAETTIPLDVFGSILGSSIDDVITQFTEKHSVRSRIIHGALARKVMAAVLLATGQDVSQLAISANAIETNFEVIRSKADESLITGLKFICIIPNLELSSMGAKNFVTETSYECFGSPAKPDRHVFASSELRAQRLAEILSASVLAAELGATAQRKAVPGSERKPFTTNTKIHRIPLKANVAEVARGLSTSLKKISPCDGANVSIKARGSGHSAYVELVAEKCAAEFGWADPRLTVP